MICNVSHTKCLKTSIPESSLLHSSSNMCDPCPAVQADPYAHVQKDKNVSHPKRIEQVQKQPEEEGQHHLFLYAVAADCVQCVKYWIHRGMDIEKETKHMKYTAMDWAEWSAATKVEQLLKEQLNANQSDGDESSEMDDTPGGVWRAVDVKMEEDEDVESEICDLQITNGDEYAFWSSAMSGNWIDTKEWCEVTSMIPQTIHLENRDLAPPRAYYWGLRQYLQFAKLCCSSEQELDGLNKTLALVWTREQAYVRNVLDFVKAVNAVDEQEYASMIGLFSGSLSFESLVDIDSVDNVS